MTRGGSPFAHVLGTLRSGIENVPGTEDSTDIAHTRLGEDPGVQLRRARGNVSVRISHEPATLQLRRFLSATVRSCQELYGNVSHLGLPQTSACNKMPWFRDAMDRPEVAVRLSLHQRAMLRAQSLPPLPASEVHHRPRPHFRTHPPGIKTVITANLLLVYLVCTIKV